MDAHHDGSLLRACEQLIQDLAERELRRWLSLHPHHAEAHSLLGWCLAVQKRPAEALAAAQEAVRLAPDMAHAHRVLASVQIEAGRDREAEHSIRAALELAPSEAEYYAVLATALLNQPLRLTGRAALRAADAGLALDPACVECGRRGRAEGRGPDHHHHARFSAHPPPRSADAGLGAPRCRCARQLIRNPAKLSF